MTGSGCLMKHCRPRYPLSVWLWMDHWWGCSKKGRSSFICGTSVWVEGHQDWNVALEWNFLQHSPSSGHKWISWIHILQLYFGHENRPFGSLTAALRGWYPHCCYWKVSSFPSMYCRWFHKINILNSIYTHPLTNVIVKDSWDCTFQTACGNYLLPRTMCFP